MNLTLNSKERNLNIHLDPKEWNDLIKKKDTHIIDTLFPNKPLSDFKTLFGTNPAVEMTREAIGNIFGISSMMEEYENATTDEEKLAIRKKIEKTDTEAIGRLETTSCRNGTYAPRWDGKGD